MQLYKAYIIADSMIATGDRITSFIVTYPRIVHAEMCRHRMHSRNTASSRAIPFGKMVKEIEENPFVPIAWQESHKGMQGRSYIKDPKKIQYAKGNWLMAKNAAVSSAKSLNGSDNVTKQLCNRLLEPFMWTTEIITATEWDNFFDLRCPKYVVAGYADGLSPEASKATFRSKKDAIDWLDDLKNLTDQDWLDCNESQADIHIQAIAELMWNAYNESEPKLLHPGKWHVPFSRSITNSNIINKLSLGAEEKDKQYFDDVRIKVATARCARVSYVNFKGADDYEADIKLHDRLKDMGHWSPFEHCAMAMNKDKYFKHVKGTDSNKYGWSNNFKGFIQYRQLIKEKNNER